MITFAEWLNMISLDTLILANEDGYSLIINDGKIIEWVKDG